MVEPARPFVRGWAIEAICEHLEAVSRGEIPRLLMNVPPGFCKSLTTDVFFPAWEWGPRNMPSMRYVAFSYSADLTERDNGRFASIISSERYRELWGKEVPLPPMLGATKVWNRRTGWKIASSVKGMGTGERGDRVILDDPHNIKEAESEAIRTETVRWFREAMSNRLNDPDKSAIIVIMQRVHEEDVSGTILANDFGYTHLCIPQEYDWDRGPTSIGWTDPRTEEGELAFPERFSPEAVETEKTVLGPTAYASQHQQSPTPRGGNIIQRDWWKTWPPPQDDRDFQGNNYDPDQYPLMSLVVGSVDTSYGEKDENAYNAMTIWGVWPDRRERPQAMLMHAWRKRLPLRGVIPENATTDLERRPHWGLVEHVANSVRKLHIDVLLIEDKTRGNDLRAELVRLLRPEECQIVMIQPKADKVARLHSVQPLFAAGMVWAPDKAWAEMVIQEITTFPKSKYADLCFVAGTPILTRRGWVPIERVTTEDDCLTPAGWRPVAAAGPTGVRAVVTKRGLTGTPEHPIFTLDTGWQALHTVSETSHVATLQLCSLIKTIRRCSWNLTERPTKEWGGRGNIILRCEPSGKEFPERASKDSMLRFGSFTPKQLFRQVMSFIIETTTPLIAALKIWTAYQCVSIGAVRRIAAERAICHLWKLRDLRLLSGTSPLKGVRGTKWQPSPISRKLEKSLRIGGWREYQPDTPNAVGVAHQCPTCFPEKGSAQVNVKGRNQVGGAENTNSTIPIMPVYNLTVEGAHCYYAGGILVHNCDTTSQALTYLRRNDILLMAPEADEDYLRRNEFRSAPAPIYDV